jgi:hypothetical protein
MRIFTRGLVFVLAILGSAIAAAIGFVAWRGGEWGARRELLEVGLRIDGTPDTRTLVAAIAGAAAVLILVLGVLAAFVRQRSVTLWLGGQHPVQVPAAVVERFLRTVIDDTKGIEAARVIARSAGRGTTALGVELTVAPDADATLVASNIESRIGTMLVPSSTIVLGGRPKITIRYAMPSVRENSGRQAA